MERGKLLLVCALFAGHSLSAQDEERFLRLVMQVMQGGEPLKHFSVSIFLDNDQVAHLAPSNRDACELLLDVNAHYSLLVSRPGLQDELLSIDTHLPAEIERYEAYYCILELDAPDRYTQADAFYLDFPCAIVRWDANKAAFDHSDRYLHAIRSKTRPPGERLAHF